jgi:hypothetical protein
VHTRDRAPQATGFGLSIAHGVHAISDKAVSLDGRRKRRRTRTRMFSSPPY